ncbi:MAG TPA: ATP-binding protein, partial [Coleofasciculaceae cyanobacterium]
YSQAQQLQHKEDQEEESTPEILFTLEIESGLETIIADELRLRQMLVNLLSNALKFTDVGSEIGLKVNRWDGWVAFTVWDTGIGIPPEKQHLIFQKFQQLEQPLTRRYEGTGLGLVLTQRLARLHGGDVSFISKAGEGSHFTLLLPPCPPEGRRQGVHLGRLNTEGCNPQASNLQPTTEAKRNRLVLIVETVPRYLDSLTEQLNSLGYRVVIARAGTEAIEKARGLQPRAILLNPLLPQLSGWDVLTLLKSDAQTHHIPVLVTATQAEKEQAYDHKADGFLSLPVQKQALLQSLTSLAEQECPISKGLTILHLSPVERNPDTFTPLTTYSESSNFSAELTELLSLEHSELNYRVLEADDLEQAELLARVWHPDVVVLDSSKIADPLAYLEQFSSHPDLAVLPLVTLDRQTTEAANQITGLSAYPCLALDSSSNMTALLQVIQIAVGMCRMPNILVMDIGEQGQVGTQESSRSHTLSSQRSRYKNTSLSSSCINKEETLSTAEHHARSKGKPSQNSASTTPQSSWLQALMQYLQTAGFKTVLSSSWPEIYYQIQTQSVDLLLIRLKNIKDSSELEDGLIALAQLPNLPPVLMLDHRSNSMNESDRVVDNNSVQYSHRASQSDDIVMSRNASTASALDSLLKAVATQILHGHSLPMTQLLEQINQALEV